MQYRLVFVAASFGLFCDVNTRFVILTTVASCVINNFFSFHIRVTTKGSNTSTIPPLIIQCRPPDLTPVMCTSSGAVLVMT